tara:strand:- start:149 stop:292 length:144 start_codon:yes stop_codon:yes gene_type:complete
LGQPYQFCDISKRLSDNRFTLYELGTIDISGQAPERTDCGIADLLVA